MAALEIPIDEVVYFDIITSSPTGSASNADATPTFSVYEEATDTAILGPTNFTQRTALTGNYRGTFTASVANGFEAGKWYSIIGSATVSSVSGKCVCMNFRCKPAEAQAGVSKVDIAYINGTTATSGETVNANVVSVSGDTTAADNLEAACDGTGYNLGNGSIVASSVTTKTGYSLVAGTGLGNQTANITGNLSGSVNSVTTEVSANVTKWLGTAPETPTVPGVPEVDITYVSGSAASPAGTVSATVADKTGFKLASDGLDTIATTAPSGSAANFREMIVQVWRRFFKKATRTSSQLRTYGDDGVTVVTSQAISADGTTETQGTA
jgi:hypothetical protein